METDRWTSVSNPIKVPILNECESNGQIGDGPSAADWRRNTSLGQRLTCFGSLVLLALVLTGVVCFLLCQTAILRLETERLKIKVRLVELQVERCNALLQDGGGKDGGWLPLARESPRQRPDTKRSDALDSETEIPASLLPSQSSASSSSSMSPGRRKRSTGKKKNAKKEKQKSQKEFAFSFETERLAICKMANCLSFTGWRPSSWVDAAYHRYYDDLSGKLEIPADGLHYIYGQISYETASALEAFAIMVDNEQLSRCYTGVDYVNPALNAAENAQRKTCHTGLALQLRKSQKVWLKSLHMEGEPISVTSSKHSSFWGVVRLSPK